MLEISYSILKISIKQKYIFEQIYSNFFVQIQNPKKLAQWNLL